MLYFNATTQSPCVLPVGKFVFRYRLFIGKTRSQFAYIVFQMKLFGGELFKI